MRRPWGKRMPDLSEELRRSESTKVEKEAGAARPTGPCGQGEDFGFYAEGGGSHRGFWREEG